MAEKEGPITDGTLSTVGLVRAVADEGERIGADPAAVSRAREAAAALEAMPEHKMALAAHEAVNALRDAMNERAPKGLFFFETTDGRWGWWREATM